MAFPNPYFPAGYNPYQQAAMQQYQQAIAPQIQPQPQAQQSNLIHVPSENHAREWTVALNSSVMFIDDNSPYIYTKTAGTSQLEPAVFKRFKIIEDSGNNNNVPQSIENATEQSPSTPQVNLSDYMTKAEFEPFKAIIDDMKKIIKELTTNEQSAE